jgi:hypothetical protein
VRCQASRANCSAAVASADFSSGASTVPRYSPRLLIIETRERCGRAGMGFLLDEGRYGAR